MDQRGGVLQRVNLPRGRELLFENKRESEREAEGSGGKTAGNGVMRGSRAASRGGERGEGVDAFHTPILPRVVPGSSRVSVSVLVGLASLPSFLFFHLVRGRNHSVCFSVHPPLSFSFPLFCTSKCGKEEPCEREETQKSKECKCYLTRGGGRGESSATGCSPSLFLCTHPEREGEEELSAAYRRQEEEGGEGG